MSVVQLTKDKRHLFIDDTLIETLAGAQINVNPPMDKHMVMSQDRPWRDRMTGYYGQVMAVDGLYRMYTGCGSGIDEKGVVEPPFGTRYGRDRFVQCLFSSDGLTWETPSLGIMPFNGSTDNNLIYASCGMEGSFFIDPGAAPGDRFCFLRGQEPNGLFLDRSSDGIRWRMSPDPVLRHNCDSMNICFWDEDRQRFMLYLRAWEGLGTPHRKRIVVHTEVESFDELAAFNRAGEYRLTDQFPAALRCDGDDPPECDIYTNAAVKYPLSDDVYLAFPSLYAAFAPSSRLNPIGHPNDGVLGTQLAVSRDGRRWRRFRRPYLITGPTGEIDSVSTYMYAGMILRGDDILQYYWGSEMTHGSRTQFAAQPAHPRNAVFAVRQRVDGFVSVDFQYSGGKLVTRPFVFEGRRLLLNVNAAAWGSLQVGLADEQGHEIDGFELTACDEIRGNQTGAVVSWEGRQDAGICRGKPVRLLIRARGAKLYSFRFE